MGRDTVPGRQPCAHCRFNPRARMGRDAPMATVKIADVLFQSTRPHGARHGLAVVVVQVLAVSIHAPAWGATYGVAGWRGAAGVSIHAPAWGATWR